MHALAKFIDSFAYKSSLMQLGDSIFSQFSQDSDEKAYLNKLQDTKGQHLKSNDSGKSG